MTLNKTILFAAFAGSALLLTACNDYLDKLPDDRAEVNTAEKVNNLLVDAYPNHAANLLLEMSSDNVVDNGAQYSAPYNQEQMYRWEDVENEGNDDPKSIWQNCYNAVATANEVLQDIDMLGRDELKGQRAEALLCRAYGMFQLANIFCLAYNPETADKDLGVPYPTEPEQSAETQYERGTMKELYEKINADIEEALPLLDDNHLTVPKYHFNTKAAYAFAARFNLFYHNFDKAIEYANQVLTATPENMLRDINVYQMLAGVKDIGNAYVQAGLNSNLLLMTAYSLAGRIFRSSPSYKRYNEGMPIVTYETFWAKGPWGSGSASSNSLYYSHILYGTDQCIYFPKIVEMFESTDKANGTGYAHIVNPVFTADETLLVRAEAYALKNDSMHAVQDINLWTDSHCSKKLNLTVADINDFENSLPYAEVDPQNVLERSPKKVLHPQGFTVAPGTQENLIQLILHMRRLETCFEGQRFLDIKRYGISFSHNLDGEPTLIFEPGDKRGAIQLPRDVLDNGLEANPR